MNATPRLYTVGHSNLSADEFLALLRGQSIGLVVDVRSVPNSQYVPHFNRAELERYLTAHGVAYRYAGEYLGGRPTEARHYKFQQIPDADTKREKFLKLVDYPAMMDDPQYRRGLARLVELVETSTAQAQVAVMCSEGDPRECHRHHLIARSLIDPNLKVTTAATEVYHILRDGSVEALNATTFADQPIQRPLF